MGSFSRRPGPHLKKDREVFPAAIYHIANKAAREAQITPKGATMDIKVLFTTFGMIFLAELGDKTQLATLAFAAETESPWSVFLGSAGALVLTSVIAVLFGASLSRWVPVGVMKTGSGVLFILLGAWLVFGALRASG